MSSKTPEEIGKSIDELSGVVSSILPACPPEEPLVVIMTLVLLSAHQALHDGCTEDDFMRICRASWAKSSEVRKRCFS